MQKKAAKTQQIIGYLRVSTQEQGASGLGLDAQREAIVAYAEKQGGTLTLFEEVESGTKIKNRPKLAEAIALTRKTKGVLVIAKLDRLARNVAFVSALMESKVEFIALDFPQADRFTIHLLAAFAEFEAKRISDRTKAALAQAKKRGVRLGSPRCRETIDACRAKGQIAIKAIADRKAHNLLPVIRDVVASGARSHAAVARALEGRHVETPRGAMAWQSGQVQAALARCGVTLANLIAQMAPVSKAA